MTIYQIILKLLKLKLIKSNIPAQIEKKNGVDSV